MRRSLMIALFAAALSLLGPQANAGSRQASCPSPCPGTVQLAPATASPGTAGRTGGAARRWVAVAAAVVLALGLTTRFVAGRQLRRAHERSSDRDG
jgi:hypothetical protein